MLHVVLRPLAAIVNALVLGIAGSRISHEDITFTLPVMVAVVVASIAFTWQIAKYNNKQIMRIKKLECEMKKLLGVKPIRPNPKGK